MKDEKDLLMSETFWGTALLLASLVLKNFGIEIDAAGWTTDIMAFIGALAAMHGRVSAKSTVGSVAGVKVK